MTIDKHWLITGAAVVIALGAGFGVARMTDRPAGEAPRAEGETHTEDAEEEGFVALAPDAATQAGVTLTEVTQGGGSELLLPGRVEFAPGAEAVIDAPLPGAVVQVHVGVGSRVKAGSPLATLRSPEGAASRATADAALAGA
ncbi:MAG: efflux transporter, family, subunit, partial [Brevundimonas sp.]|nr:efflux transporter, family, subunit [Brevundimonas sp.]